jgi:hypothetical protein
MSSFSWAFVMTGSLAPTEAHFASASGQEKPYKKHKLSYKLQILAFPICLLYIEKKLKAAPLNLLKLCPPSFRI